jgi:hypothetical protein
MIHLIGPTFSGEYPHNKSMKPIRLRHLAWSAVVGLGTLLYLLEEWLWDTLQGLMRRLGGLPILRHLETVISRLPPWGAALVFLLPTTLVLPIKLIALHELILGHWVRGTLIVLAAKVLATALFARIYVLTEPALLRVPWFVRLRAIFLRWRDWAYRQVRQHPVWQRIHLSLQTWRQRRQAWKARHRPFFGRWSKHKKNAGNPGVNQD